MEPEASGWLERSWGWVQEVSLQVWAYLSNPWFLLAFGLVVILLMVLLMLSRKQPSRIRAFVNENGHVEICRQALVDIIRSRSEQVDIEKKPGIRLRKRRGKLHVDVKITLLPSRNLTEVSQVLQKHLIETLQGSMGIRNLGKINVVVGSIRTKSGRENRALLPLMPKTDEPAQSKAESLEVMEDGTDANLTDTLKDYPSERGGSEDESHAIPNDSVEDGGDVESGSDAKKDH